MIPSSPPVRFDNCEASTSATEATASVIIAKKIALTRSDKRPIAAATTMETASPASAPRSTASQPGPICLSEMAAP